MFDTNTVSHPIAAHALGVDAVLVMSDRMFSTMANLPTEDWSAQ